MKKKSIVIILSVVAFVLAIAIPDYLPNDTTLAEKNQSIGTDVVIYEMNKSGFTSLRGDASIPATNKAPELYKWKHDVGLVARNYITQPPLIPHPIKRYKINQRQNKCLVCHGWKNYREWGATKISLTHFQNRAGNELSKVSPLRYFCTQCHVPQKDAKPLVNNIFEPINLLKQTKG